MYGVQLKDFSREYFSLAQAAHTAGRNLLHLHRPLPLATMSTMNYVTYRYPESLDGRNRASINSPALHRGGNYRLATTEFPVRR